MTATAKGQVTRPKPVRDLLGLAPGSKVDFLRTADGGVKLVSADEPQSPSRFTELRGQAGLGLGTDAIMALTCGEAWLIGTNVLLDLVIDDREWAAWSIEQLESAALRRPLLINDVIYAELSVRYDRIEDLDAFVEARRRDSHSLPCRMRRYSWPPKPLRFIADPRARAQACCRISSSAPTRRSTNCRR